MSARPSVLVIDDDASLREALVSTLEEAGYIVHDADGIRAGRDKFEQVEPDAVLLDIRLRDGDGLELLADLRARHPKTPIIIATAYGDSDHTITAMRNGAFELVTKPFDVDVLLTAVRRAVRVPERAPHQAPARSGALVGSSSTMLEIWKAIGRAAASQAPVLVTGESGVGKELVARAVHDHGARTGPFLATNLAALPANLIESELFGHEKGAFTGASSRREGRFEQAGTGTLFLDEIGDLHPALQTKLLRVLEDGRFERVGGNEVVHSRARIIAATSQPVDPRSAGSTLREDLYYRLGVIRIEVPPLRARRQDIPLLVDAFLRSNGNGGRAVTEAALRALTAYDWPGNVRELRHTLENACVMSRAEVLDVVDLSLPQGRPSEDEPVIDDDLNLAVQVARTEKRVIARALALAKGNRAHAARLLGIRRALLYVRMRELGLGEHDEPGEA